MSSARCFSSLWFKVVAFCAAALGVSVPQVHAAGLSGEVIYVEQTETPNGFMPFIGSYVLKIRAPEAYPTDGTSTAVGFTISLNGPNPLAHIPGAPDPTTFITIALEPGQPTAFTGPNQEILYRVSFNFPSFPPPEGQDSIIYGYKVLSTNWPIERIEEETDEGAAVYSNGGHDIFATASVPPVSDEGEPPVVSITDPINSALFGPYLVGSVPATIDLEFDAFAGETDPVITSLKADLAGPWTVVSGNEVPAANYAEVPLSNAITVSSTFPLDSRHAQGTVTMPIPGLVLPGSYIYRVTVGADNDAGSATPVTHTFIVQVDPVVLPEPPVVTIATPLDGETFTVPYTALDSQGRTTIPLTFTATAPNLYPVTQVAWWVDNGNQTVQATNSGSVTTTGSMLVTAGNNAGEGDHTVFARATNSVGNDQEAHDFSVRVTDAPPPIVSISQPAAATYQFVARADPNSNPYQVPFAFSASSVARGGLIRSVVATLDGSTTPLSITTTPLNATNVGGSATLSFTAAGSHTLEVIAIDDYGNAVASDAFTIVVHDVSATLDITDPAPGSIHFTPADETVTDVAFSFHTQTDSPFVVHSVSATLNGNPVTGISTPNLMTSDAVSSGTLADLPVGPYTLVARAVVRAPDVEGELIVTDTVTFEVRRPAAQPQPPTVVINTPADGAEFTIVTGGPSLTIPLTFTGRSVTPEAVITALTAKLGTESLTVTATNLNTPEANGAATLTITAAGTYTIEVTATDAHGTAIATSTFTVVAAAGRTVSGIAFFDADRDGNMDGIEFGLAGITLELRDGSDAVVATTTSGANGSYSFPSVAPGTYNLTATAYAGLSATNGSTRSVTVSDANVTVTPIGFGLDFAAICGMTANGYSHGFWKSNIGKALNGHTHGAQIPAATLRDYTEQIAGLALSPYDNLTLSRAYSILSSNSSSASALLSKQLLASEYNYANGAYINGNQALTFLFIWWGESLLADCDDAGTAQLLFAKDWFDAYNNSHGGAFCGPGTPSSPGPSTPTIVIDAPANGAEFLHVVCTPDINVPFSFTATASSGYDIESVAAWLDDCPISLGNTTGLDTQVASSSGTLVRVDSGTHTLKVKAVSGGVTVWKTATFKVKDVDGSPAVTIASPTPNQVFTYQSGGTAPAIPLEFSATSPVGPIRKLTAKLNNSSLTFTSAGVGTPSASGSIANLGLTNAGTYTVTVTATNDYDSKTVSTTFKIKIVEPDLCVEITAPHNSEEFPHTTGTPALNIPFAFKATVSTGFAIDAVSATLDGQAVAVSTAGLGTTNAQSTGTLSSVTAGTHTLKVTAVTGALSKSDTITFKVRDVPATSPSPSGVAIVRHGFALNGGIDGSVQVLLPEDVTLNGDAWIAGDLFVPGTPEVKLNGKPTYAGTQDGTGAASPTKHDITLNGKAVLRHVVRRTDAVEIPTVAAPPAPTGTRKVTLNSSGDSAGNFATIRDLTLNGKAGTVAVPPGTYGKLTANGKNGFKFGVAGSDTPAVYNLQDLTLNGDSELELAGPVIVTLASGVTLSGNLGSTDKPEWLVLRIANGGLTLNGNIDVGAYVLAPKGTITINGKSVLSGGVVCDDLKINGNAVLEIVE